MPNRTMPFILLYTDPADQTRRWRKFPTESALTTEVDRIDAAHPGFADMDGNSVESPDSPGWLAFETASAYGAHDQLPAESESSLWYVTYTDSTGDNLWAAYEDAGAAAAAADKLRASSPAPVFVYSYNDYAL